MYKFKEPKNTACFVCNHVLNKERSLLFVTHDKEDSSWQFLCGEYDHTEENIRIVSLEQVTALDNSVNDLCEMPVGIGAERTSVDSEWKPFRIAD